MNSETFDSHFSYVSEFQVVLLRRAAGTNRTKRKSLSRQYSVTIINGTRLAPQTQTSLVDRNEADLSRWAFSARRAVGQGLAALSSLALELCQLHLRDSQGAGGHFAAVNSDKRHVRIISSGNNAWKRWNET